MADADGIPIRTLDREAPGQPAIMALHEYWRSLNGGWPPRRKAFDFMAVYKSAPYLLMAERLAPMTFKFIYCGTFVAENFPLDLTGKTYGQATQRTSRVNWPSFFSEVLDTPCLRFGRAPVDWPNDEFSEILYGVFPLAGDGGKPTHALACLVFQPKDPFTGP